MNAQAWEKSWNKKVFLIALRSGTYQFRTCIAVVDIVLQKKEEKMR